MRQCASKWWCIGCVSTNISYSNVTWWGQVTGQVIDGEWPKATTPAWSLNVVTPLLQCSYDSEQFSIVDFIVSFSRREGFRDEGARMSVPIQVKLSEYGTWCIFWSITFNLNWFSMVRHDEDLFFREVFFSSSNAFWHSSVHSNFQSFFNRTLSGLVISEKWCMRCW